MSGIEAGAAHAEGAVLAVDWRQCSLCVPSDPSILPPHLSYDIGHEVLLVATQTCSLVGPGAEPAFEVVVASLLDEFHADAAEARGRVTRFLHLPVEGSTGPKAISLDVS